MMPYGSHHSLIAIPITPLCGQFANSHHLSREGQTKLSEFIPQPTELNFGLQIQEATQN